MSPILLLSLRLRDAAEPEEARKVAAALAAVAGAAERALTLAAEIRLVGRFPPHNAEEARKLGDQLARDAEGIARQLWAGDPGLRVSPVDYLVWLLPCPTTSSAAVTAEMLERLGKAVAVLTSLAANLREVGQDGTLAERAVAYDIAVRVAAVAADLGAAWAKKEPSPGGKTGARRQQ